MANDALKAAWQLFWHNSNYLLTVTLLTLVPTTLFMQVLTAYFSPLVAMAIYIVPSTVVNFAYIGALAHGLDTAWRGEHLSYGELYVRGLRSWWGILLGSLLVFLCIIPGMLLCIIPGFIISIKLAFVPYAIALEGTRPTEAISQSWQRTNGLTGAIFLALLAVMVPIMLVGMLVGLGAGIAATGVDIPLFSHPITVYLQNIASGIGMLFLYCLYFAFYQYALQRERDALPVAAEEAG